MNQNIENMYETYVVRDSLLPFHIHAEALEPSLYYPNWHDDLEIVYIMSGSGFIRCKSEKYKAQKGDVFIFNSGEIHSTNTKKQMDLICIIPTSKFCRDNGFDTNKLIFKTHIKDDKINNYILRVYDDYINLEKSEALPLQGSINKAKIRTQILNIIIDLSERYLCSFDESANNYIEYYYAKKVLEYISKNYNKKITVDDLASFANVSKYHLTREFKKATGHTINSQINIYKCAIASKMISDGMSVSDAATQCGYDNSSYFSQLFKRVVGVSPSHYIKDSKDNNIRTLRS